VNRNAVCNPRTLAVTCVLMSTCVFASIAQGQPNTSRSGGPIQQSAAPSVKAATAIAEPSSGETPAPATKPEGALGGIVGVLISAGAMMIPILACSIVLLMFVLERVISLRRRRVIPKHFVKLFLNELGERQLKPIEALELCEENSSPISEVFAAGVKKWNRPSVEVEQAVLDAGERVAHGLRRYLRLFNGIATISPLLGLLGTVLGMIEAFNAIASSSAMGRPELLAEGISQALLTTAGGLSVAIPAFIAYMYFTGRVDKLIIEIDGLGQEVVAAIASDAWKPNSSRKAKTSSKAA
jgi:biopolymer transport protein ExbB